jgi:hypothetical protein
MIWLTWRQHRLQGWVLLGVLVLVAVFLVIAGLEMASSFGQLGLRSCLRQIAKGNMDSTCAGLVQAFESQNAKALVIVNNYLILLPLVLGALVGAPLVAQEVEQHTHLLVWTQSITRLRWVTVQLALVLGAGLLASGALLPLLIWWRSPSAQIDGSWAGYNTSGPVWVATTLLALALGVFAGALTRRVIVAILLTIALFVAITAPVQLWWRPNFEPPVTVTWPAAQPAPPATSTLNWQIATGFIDAHGNRTDTIETCTQTPLPNGKGNANRCALIKGVKGYEIYQPANRFWTFQWIETGIYLAFSVLALGVTVWWVRRRLN